MSENVDSIGKVEECYNRFALIKMLGNRVRQLELGSTPMVETSEKSLLAIAYEEFEAGKIKIYKAINKKKGKTKKAASKKKA